MKSLKSHSLQITKSFMLHIKHQKMIPSVSKTIQFTNDALRLQYNFFQPPNHGFGSLSSGILKEV